MSLRLISLFFSFRLSLSISLRPESQAACTGSTSQARVHTAPQNREPGGVHGLHWPSHGAQCPARCTWSERPSSPAKYLVLLNYFSSVPEIPVPAPSSSPTRFSLWWRWTKTPHRSRLTDAHLHFIFRFPQHRAQHQTLINCQPRKDAKHLALGHAHKRRM